MSYSWEMHLSSLRRWLSNPEAPDDGEPRRLFALIDTGQLPTLDHKIARIVTEGSVQLFADTFAEAALPLSPRLMPLDALADRAFEQLMRLSTICQTRPMLSVLGSNTSCAQLSAHLRGLLRITLDGTDYLWRLADTQMLQATMRVLDGQQQQQACGPCLRWWIIDHETRLWQLAPPTPTPEPWGTPLALDDIQERALMDAAAGPMLASQLRTLDASFAQALSHAQQSAFADDCLRQAEVEAICHDEELVTWSLQRWQDHRPAGVPVA